MKVKLVQANNHFKSKSTFAKRFLNIEIVVAVTTFRKIIPYNNNMVSNKMLRAHNTASILAL